MKTAHSKAAAQYAEAVLQLAEQSKGKSETKLDQQVLKDLEYVNLTLSKTPDIWITLAHPGIAAAEKKNILTKLFSNQVNDLTFRLISLLADKRRLQLLKHIELQYKELYRARKNIAAATLTSAEPLAANLVDRLKDQLEKQLAQSLELELAVDPGIIGGLVLKVGDQVIDGSIKGKLRSIERAFLSN